MVCATTPTARIAPTFGMTDAMNGKEGRMTLFNKLAGKASALLNASGICSNNCIDGHCSGCGECCADLLPLTKGEIKRLRDYARKHHLQENKRSFLETKGGPDLSCPFRNEHTKQCDVYSVRPLICKEYICSRLLQKPIAQTGLTKEKRDIHSLRWEVFKNPECENLLKEAQKAAMKRRFEIAFKVNPDSEFYKNYFMKKAEKEKFLELADEFVEKYFLGEWLSLAFSARLTIRLNAEGTRKYAPQTTKHSNLPGFSTFKKQSSMNHLWENEVCKCVD